MSRRQTEGGETWRRLRDWDRGQAPSERLSAHILRAEGYESIDPSHPLGGQDGLKDIVYVKDKEKYIGASYFPRGQQNIAGITAKFMKDLEGVPKNGAKGLAFITNQEIILAERDDFTKRAAPIFLDLFHLERIVSILDSPQFYGIRLEYLDIEMTKEEQLAFLATVSQVTGQLNEIVSYMKKSEIIRKELNKLMGTQDIPETPKLVSPEWIYDDPFLSIFGFKDKIIRCSYCGFGFRVKGENLLTTMQSVIPRRAIAKCPRCGNAEYV